MSNNKACTFGSHRAGATSEGGNWTALCLGVVRLGFFSVFFFFKCSCTDNLNTLLFLQYHSGAFLIRGMNCWDEKELLK